MTQAALDRGELSPEDVSNLARGEVQNFFLHSRAQISAEELRALTNYFQLFKILPAIPARLRSRVKAEWLAYIPGSLLEGLVTGTRVAMAVAQRDPEFWRWPRRYLFQIRRSLKRRLQRSGASASLPILSRWRRLPNSVG